MVLAYHNAVEVEWPDPIQAVGCGSTIIRAINVVCGVVWFGVVWCGVVWFGVVWCGVM